MTAETTFRAFTTAQGANYAQHRRSYNPKLYEVIISYHTTTGGQLDTLCDIGCGPGIATRDLAPYFQTAIGLDPSEGMIANAKSLAGTSSRNQPIRYEVCTAEDLGTNLAQPIPDASVDLITAATAAHWFDMSQFWPRAARALKPGGTVAIWGSNSGTAHPSVPNAGKINAAIARIEEEELRQYMVAGNLMARDLLRGLVLPWGLDCPVEEFERGSFVREEFGGEVSDNEEAEEFFAGQPVLTLDMAELIIGTASPVIRWREAHPGDVGTERDVVKQMRREIEKFLWEAGVEKGKELLRGSVEGVLLMFKKRQI